MTKKRPVGTGNVLIGKERKPIHRAIAAARRRYRPTEPPQRPGARWFNYLFLTRGELICFICGITFLFFIIYLAAIQ